MNGGQEKEVGIRLLSKVTLFDYNVSTMLSSIVVSWLWQREHQQKCPLPKLSKKISLDVRISGLFKKKYFFYELFLGTRNLFINKKM